MYAQIQTGAHLDPIQPSMRQKRSRYEDAKPRTKPHYLIITVKKQSLHDDERRVRADRNSIRNRVVFGAIVDWKLVDRAWLLHNVVQVVGKTGQIKCSRGSFVRQQGMLLQMCV